MPHVNRAFRAHRVRRLCLAVLAGALVLPLGAQLKLPKVELPKVVPLPTAELTGFSLRAISLRDVTFQFELTVKNPYPVDLSFSGMTLVFGVEGAEVFRTASQGGFKVPANQTKANDFTVTLAYEGIIKLVKNYAEKDLLATTIDGTLVIPLPRLAAFPSLPKDVSFDYHLSQKIPAIKPTVSIEAFTVKAPDLKAVQKGLATAASKVKAEDVADFLGALAAGKKPSKAPLKPTDIDVPFTVSFTLAIRNEAKAALSFASLDYGLAVSGQDLVAGQSSQVRQEGASTLVTIDSTFSSTRLAQAVIDVFAAKKGSFRITGKASLVVPKELSKTPLPLAFDEGGDFRVE